MSSFDRSTHRLAGSGDESGGLIIKKKQDQTRDSKSDETFKRPSGSLLGLDVLARRKRAEKDAEDGGSGVKRPRIERKWDKKDSNYDDSGIRLSFGRSDGARDRKYRSALSDTPSHPGGVSEQALEKMQNRLKRDQGQGLYASSSAEGRGREQRKERDREPLSSKSERERGGGGGRGEDRGDESQRRVREREWEQETPDRGRGNTTPYLKTRGRDTHHHDNIFCVCGEV